MSTDIYMNNDVGIDETRSSAEIQEDIRDTRGRMDATLDQLGNKLNARSLVNSALDWWDSPDHGQSTQDNLKSGIMSVARQARKHPMPAVLIGSGVAWLVSELADKDESVKVRSATNTWQGPTSGKASTLTQAKDGLSGTMGSLADKTSAASSDALDSVKNAASSVGEGIHDAADRIGHRAKSALDSGKAGAGHLMGELRHGYDMGSDKFTRSCKEYPLAVGLAFAAAGALVGLVIPRSKREDAMMGSQSDDLMADAKEKAGDFFEKGKEVGSKVLETVKSEAAEQGLDTANAAGLMKDIVQKGTEVVEKAKSEVVSAAHKEGLASESKAASDRKFLTPS